MAPAGNPACLPSRSFISAGDLHTDGWKPPPLFPPSLLPPPPFPSQGLVVCVAMCVGLSRARGLVLPLQGQGCFTRPCRTLCFPLGGALHSGRITHSLPTDGQDVPPTRTRGHVCRGLRDTESGSGHADSPCARGVSVTVTSVWAWSLFPSQNAAPGGRPLPVLSRSPGVPGTSCLGGHLSGKLTACWVHL